MLGEKVYFLRGNFMRNTIKREPGIDLFNKSKNSFVGIVEDEPGRNTVLDSWVPGFRV